MPGTTSTALPSFSHEQHRETERKGGAVFNEENVNTEQMSIPYNIVCADDNTDDGRSVSYYHS